MPTAAASVKTRFLSQVVGRSKNRSYTAVAQYRCLYHAMWVAKRSASLNLRGSMCISFTSQCLHITTLHEVSSMHVYMCYYIIWVLTFSFDIKYLSKKTCICCTQCICSYWWQGMHNVYGTLYHTPCWVCVQPLPLMLKLHCLMMYSDSTSLERWWWSDGILPSFITGIPSLAYYCNVSPQQQPAGMQLQESRVLCCINS